MQSTAYEELFAAARTKDPAFEQAKGEATQVHLHRLLVAIESVDDSVWDGLKESTQDWYHEGVKAYQAKVELAVPEGYVAPAISKPRARIGQTPVATVFEDIVSASSLFGFTVKPSDFVDEQTFLYGLVESLNGSAYEPAGAVATWYQSAFDAFNADASIEAPAGFTWGAPDPLQANKLPSEPAPGPDDIHEDPHSPPMEDNPLKPVVPGESPNYHEPSVPEHPLEPTMPAAPVLEPIEPESDPAPEPEPVPSEPEPEQPAPVEQPAPEPVPAEEPHVDPVPEPAPVSVPEPAPDAGIHAVGGLNGSAAPKKGRKPKVNKAAAVATVAPIKAKGRSKRGAPGSADTVTAVIRGAVIDNQKISVPDLQSALAQKGLFPTAQTVTSTRASQLAAMRVMLSKGWTPPRHNRAAAA